MGFIKGFYKKSIGSFRVLKGHGTKSMGSFKGLGFRGYFRSTGASG